MPTVDQIDYGLVLRVGGGKLRRLVVVGGARVAGNITGDEFGGGRSSGELGTKAAGHGMARGKVC